VKRRAGGLARRARGEGSAPPARTAAGPELSWTDAKLVRECVAGNEDAWAALLEKYKNLIFSIPVRRGLPREDASDVFQRVCLLLLAELPRLREPKALPMWLIRVTAHECERWRRQEHPYATRDAPDNAGWEIADERPLAEEMLVQGKEEQALRDAVRGLPSRCGRLIEMLFFEAPARPYQEIAAQLGLAIGSIGFIRGRCLTRLRRELERQGFR
jgi:RNA polymerase sigma factor (sigma-70 family)